MSRDDPLAGLYRQFMAGIQISCSHNRLEKPRQCYNAAYLNAGAEVPE